MNKEYFQKIQDLWAEVAEKMDPVNPKALKGKHSDRKDKDIDNDGDVDSSDEYLHKRRKAISKAMQKEDDDKVKPCPKCDGSMDNHEPECPLADNDDDDDDDMKEASDINTGSVDKALSHDCAKHVASEQWGFGECIPGQHTLVEQADGSGLVTHYDVLFEHGIEMDVPVEELTILVSEAHKHTAKKMKEGATYGERTKGAAPAETMKDKRKGKAADDMAADHDADNPKVIDAADPSAKKTMDQGADAIKQSPARPGDNRKGDLKPVKQGGK